MTFPEFITYCKLKDLIVRHERLDNEWHAKQVNKQILVIENDNWLASITYIHFAGKHDILDAQFCKVTARSDSDVERTNLETIISKFA